MGGDYDSLSVLTSNSFTDNTRSSWNFKTGLDWMPSPKTTWNIGLRANEGVSSGIEDVVNLESWSTDALGGFTRYGLSERENASMDIDLGYEHKYGERHVLASPLPAGLSGPTPRTTPCGRTCPSALLDPGYLSNANLNDGGNWNATLQVDYEKPLGQRRQTRTRLQEHLAREQ